MLVNSNNLFFVLQSMWIVFWKCCFHLWIQFLWPEISWHVFSFVNEKLRSYLWWRKELCTNTKKWDGDHRRSFCPTFCPNLKASTPNLSASSCHHMQGLWTVVFWNFPELNWFEFVYIWYDDPPCWLVGLWQGCNSRQFVVLQFCAPAPSAYMCKFNVCWRCYFPNNTKIGPSVACAHCDVHW